MPDPGSFTQSIQRSQGQISDHDGQGFTQLLGERGYPSKEAKNCQPLVELSIWRAFIPLAGNCGGRCICRLPILMMKTEIALETFRRGWHLSIGRRVHGGEAFACGHRFGQLGLFAHVARPVQPAERADPPTAPAAHHPTFSGRGREKRFPCISSLQSGETSAMTGVRKQWLGGR